jgi:hypothetical protein
VLNEAGERISATFEVDHYMCVTEGFYREGGGIIVSTGGKGGRLHVRISNPDYCVEHVRATFSKRFSGVMVVKLRQAEPGRIRGRIIKESLEPLIGTHIGLRSSDLNVMLMESSDGIFEFVVPPGDYDIIINCPEYLPIVVQDVIVESGLDLHLNDIMMELIGDYTPFGKADLAKCVGEIVDLRGLGLENANATLFRSNDPIGGGSTYDENGVFVFWAEPGIYELRILSTGFNMLRFPAIQFEAGKCTYLRFALYPINLNTEF